jgi:CTP synthase
MVATRNSNWTTGKIYLSVIQKSAAATISAGPFRSSRTSRTKSRTPSAWPAAMSMWCWSKSAARSATSRACRSSKRSGSSGLDVGRENTLYIHLTLVPFIGTAGELKTKPTQHSVRDLRSIGISRTSCSAAPIGSCDADIKRKIALFCDVPEEAVITAKDVDTIYEVPLVLKAEGLDQIVLKQLGLPLTQARTDAWEELVDRIKQPTDELTIHVVGKYTATRIRTRA